jgi:Cys-tRNA(Pro) deacylase
MHSSAERVADILRALGVETQIVEFSQTTRTAQDAAAAIGAAVGQIVKSLVFVADGRPVLALVSGANRLDVNKLRGLLGAAYVDRADADTVRQATGYAIGGVPPVGHAQALPVVLDRDLLQYDTVYAAAGTPHAVFAIAPGRLVQITGATAADLAQQPETQ